MTRVLVALVEDRGSEPGLDRAEELPQIVVANQFRFEVHGESLARAPVGAEPTAVDSGADASGLEVIGSSATLESRSGLAGCHPVIRADSHITFTAW